jgi:hypothetical protein
MGGRKQARKMKTKTLLLFGCAEQGKMPLLYQHFMQGPRLLLSEVGSHFVCLCRQCEISGLASPQYELFQCMRQHDEIS